MTLVRFAGFKTQSKLGCHRFRKNGEASILPSITFQPIRPPISASRASVALTRAPANRWTVGHPHRLAVSFQASLALEQEHRSVPSPPRSSSMAADRSPLACPSLNPFWFPSCLILVLSGSGTVFGRGVVPETGGGWCRFWEGDGAVFGSTVLGRGAVSGTSHPMLRANRSARAGRRVLDKAPRAARFASAFRAVFSSQPISRQIVEMEGSQRPDFSL